MEIAKNILKTMQYTMRQVLGTEVWHPDTVRLCFF